MNSRRLRDSVVFAILWIPYALLTHRFWWLCDDAFISFRYARNWADGLGLRFNPAADPPVEGYSNFLWTAFCAVLELLGLDVTLWPPLVSFACGSILLYLVFDLLRRRCELSLLPACLATLFLGCAPPYLVWSTGGLETVPFALLMFVTFERLVLRRDGPAPLGGGIAGLGLALIRTEGAAWSLLIGLLAVVHQLPAWWRARRPATRPPPDRKQQRKAKRLSGREKQKALKRKSARTGPSPEPAAAPHTTTARPLRPILLYFAIVGVGFAVYFTCRYAYFGEPFSNTTYAKMGLVTATLGRGARYVGAYFLALVTPIVFLPACVTALRRRMRSIGLPVVVMALASLGYAVATGADFMTMWRFLVPGFVVFNALLLGWFLQACWRRSTPGRVAATVLGAAVVGLSLLPAWDIHLLPDSVRKHTHFRGRWTFRSEHQMWQHMSTNSKVWTQYGLALKEHTQPGDSCVLVFIGAIGYYSDLYVYDMAGLVTPEVARREGAASDPTPGHDKQVPFSYFLKDRPTVLFVVEKPQTAGGVTSWARQFQKWQTADRYVADFMPVQLDDHPEQTYLVVLRRIKEGTDPADAWKSLLARVRALRRLDAPAGAPARP